MNRTGIVFVVSGPSGAGKSTICNTVLKTEPNLRFSVSCTTRAARRGEIDGEDYHFTTPSGFQDHVDKGDFLEYAEVHGHMYGTLAAPISDDVDRGLDILLDIDVQGVSHIQKAIDLRASHLTNAICYTLILPPSREELERRLRSRGTEAEATIKRRLEAVEFELGQWRCYDYLVTNNHVDLAIEDLRRIILAERMKIARMPGATPWN